MYVWWSECGLGFGSDADNFELKNINVRVWVWPHWWFVGSEIGVDIGLSVCIMV